MPLPVGQLRVEGGTHGPRPEISAFGREADIMLCCSILPLSTTNRQKLSGVLQHLYELNEISAGVVQNSRLNVT